MSKKNLLNSVKVSAPKKNRFDLSHDVKLTGNMGELIPTLCMDAVPGDSFKISCDSLVRLAPLVSPMMHRCDVYHHYFFVPKRLLWDNWEDYISNGGVSGVFPTHPYFEINPAGVNLFPLLNYMGLPKKFNADQTADVRVNAMQFAAYQCIYNEYYRDENLQPEIPFKLVDGNNSPYSSVFFPIRKRAWEHDYFTSCLPFAQKGPTVDMPQGPFFDSKVENFDPVAAGSPVVTTLTGNNYNPEVRTQGDNSPDYGGSSGVGLFAKTSDLQQAAPSINDLRFAERVQEWYEKLARGGSRYVELLKAFFGVKPQDARFQRPEYITGTSSPIIISEVLQNSATSAQPTPQGNMAGHGVSVNQGYSGDFYVPEYGYIIGIMSVMPKPAYMQGIPRQFLTINNPAEQYWPQFANLGEQAVLNNEIYAYHADGDKTFGYLPRYTEFKFQPNRTAGDFCTSLAYWTMTRKFNNLPGLNGNFIECVPTTDVFAVTGAIDHLYCQVLHNITAIRPMPFYGTPTF